ncbi:hypothetical protein Sste5346_003868 [Sporothrix stenoceras]|uniref:SMP-30/Gluconolactonase/LRE-like region domain-containing protein n=1 Tax=Sporothrix stenoceras TaxID=5173 RepID=A0ABR3ZCE5_9PEZI
MQLQKGLSFATSVALALGPAPSSASPSRSNCNLTVLDSEYTHLLPLPFEGNLTRDFLDGTALENQTVAAVLANAQKSAFVSYDDEFTRLIGSATLDLIVPDAPFPNGEAGIWVPDLNQVWFVTTLYGGPTKLYILFLENNTVVEPQLTATAGYGTHIPLANPAGGYYFNGTVYLALVGTDQEPASVVSVDPRTYVVRPVVNSYFGLELPPVDDLVVTYTNTSRGVEKHLYLSTLDLSAFGLTVGRPAAVLPNAFWMFTPETGALQPIIPRADIFIPNGVAVSKDFRHLFVTDTSATASVGGGALWNVTGSPAIYRYDLSPTDGLVSNKVFFGMTREGVSDGIKVDDKGRVWTAEYEGIVVRNSVGKVIGLFNKEVILGTQTPVAEMANFALAGDTLVLLALDKIYTVKLAETVVSPDRYTV